MVRMNVPDGIWRGGGCEPTGRELAVGSPQLGAGATVVVVLDGAASTGGRVTPTELHPAASAAPATNTARGRVAFIGTR
jgi:hypothetical protein